MTVVGYVRTSAFDSDASLQETALRAWGCDVIRTETRGRDELTIVLGFLAAGDTLMVTRVDRVARSVGELHDIVGRLRARGVVLKATEQPIDTTAKAFVDTLAVLAGMEANLRREWHLEGVARAKANHVYKGRTPSVEASAVRQLKARGMGATAIAKALGIGRASVYRALREKNPRRPPLAPLIDFLCETR